MRKHLATILAFAVMLSLASCASTPPATQTPIAPATPPPASQPPAEIIRLAPSSPQNRPVFTSGDMPATEIVETNYGSLTGVYNEDQSVKAFAGVPYAAPPLGEFRFKAPQPLEAWEGILACDLLPDAPMQTAKIQEGISEDCLYMNIWTPAETGEEKLPVILYMFPGGYTQGSASQNTYDGEEMAKKGVIFISVNSRVGIFGFFPHPDLSAESEFNVSGNYGMLDQLEALKWIQENIAAFGGDPDRVTIAGHSAGGKSVNIFTVSPLAAGLFHRGICSSSACFGVPGDHAGGVNQLRTLDELSAQGATYLDEQNVTIADLRAMSSAELMEFGVPTNRICRPVIDGYVIPDTVYNLFATGQQNGVQIMVGNTYAEAGPYYLAMEKEYENYDYDTVLANAERIYGPYKDEFLAIYPSDTPEQALHDKVYALTDNQYTWHVREWGQLDSLYEDARVYCYNFSRFPVDSPESRTMQNAYHCSDILYWLGNLKFAAENEIYNAYDQELSEIASSYIVNFAATGDPNGPGLPTWEPFAANAQFMGLGDDVKMVNPPHEEALDFWEEYEAYLRNE